MVVSFPKEAVDYWNSIKDNTKPHYEELIKTLYSIDLTLISCFPNNVEKYTFISSLQKDIKILFKFLSSNHNDINENLIKQLRKDAKNLNRKINQNVFKRNPSARAKSHKSTMLSISKKINRVIDENNSKDKRKTRSIAFDIFSAINGGKLDRVKEFVDKNPKVLTLGDDNGNLPIHLAINKTQEDIVEYILKENSSVVSFSNSDGLIPLEVAIMNNDMNMVKLVSSYTDAKFVDLKYILHCDDDIRQFLLKKYPNRLNEPCPDRDEVKNKTKQTPIHKVSVIGRNDVLNDILNNDGDPNITDINGNTPLHCAVTFNNPNCTRTLISKGADIDKANNAGNTPLITAVSVADKDTVQILMDAGADTDITNNESESVVLLAVARNNNDNEKQDILNSLIINHADVNQQDDKGYTPLILATSNKDKESINTLLDVKDIDIDAATEDGFTALTFSTINDDIDTCSKLMKMGADTEITTLNEKAPTHYASSVSVLNVLVNDGADINAKDQNGQTPLFTFVQSGFSDLALKSIELGANVSHVDDFNNTILHESAAHGDSKVTETIINLSKEPGILNSNEFTNTNEFINFQNNSGLTPMHQACTYSNNGTEDIFNILSNNGASLSIPDINGNLPIHYAAQTNNPNLSNCINHNTESINYQNHNQNTPLHLAADAEQKDAVDKLIAMDNINFELQNDKGMVASEATGNPLISQSIALRRMNKQYQAKDGEIVIGLKWFDWNDLDIHVICSCGIEICYKTKKCEHCELDIDMNVDGDQNISNSSNSDQAIEHITFENTPPDGKYKVIITLYSIFDKRTNNCDYSVFMVQKDSINKQVSDLVFFAKHSFEDLDTIDNYNQIICEFEILNGNIVSMNAPEGKEFVNKVKNISIPLDYQRQTENDSNPTIRKFLPKMRVIPPKDIEDD